MSFSYLLAEGLPNERDQVRLLIGDTNADDYTLEDEEIDFFLSQEPNIYWAAAASANAYITKLEGAYWEDQKVGETRLRSKRINELKGLIDQWRARGAAHMLPSAGGIYRSESEAMDQRTDLRKGDFYRGMDDFPGTTDKSSPRLGRNDYN